MPESLLLPSLATLGCLLGCWLCCRKPVDLEQARVLPFADDPDAAARMTHATGQPCEVTTRPLDDPEPMTAETHWLA